MTRRLWLTATVAMWAPSKSRAGEGVPGEDDYARRIFDLVNELRVTQDAPALQWSERIAECARAQSDRKMKLRFAGHEDPQRGGVGERLNAAGIGWSGCAENLFTIRGYDDPVNFAIVFWWYSAGHRANMLKSDYTMSGIGVTQSEDGTFFVTQIFAEPRSPRR